MSKADHDLRNAAHTLKIRRRCPTNPVCYHAQQCVENYIKVGLVWSGIDIPRIHDLAVLLRTMPRALRPDLMPKDQEDLTRAATEGRDPGSAEPSMDEARRAVLVARAVRTAVRRRLQMPTTTRR
jgi:HEPN domain-containing protein